MSAVARSLFLGGLAYAGDACGANPLPPRNWCSTCSAANFHRVARLRAPGNGWIRSAIALSAATDPRHWADHEHHKHFCHPGVAKVLLHLCDSGWRGRTLYIPADRRLGLSERAEKRRDYRGYESAIR